MGIKLLAIILYLLLLPLEALGQDFSKSTWGMSIEEVAKAEGRELTTRGRGLYSYQVQEGVPESPTIRFYEYDGRVLQSAILAMFPAGFQQYDEAYSTQKEGLTRYYGAPERDEMVWLDAQYKDTPDKWATALRAGDLVYQTDWRTDTSLIRMTMRDWDYVLILSVYHRSLEHQARVEELEQAKDYGLGGDFLDGFKRFSQDLEDSSIEDDGGADNDLLALFGDHGILDHALTYDLADHSVEELERELETVKKVEQTECLKNEPLNCDLFKDSKTELESELAKRR